MKRREFINSSILGGSSMMLSHSVFGVLMSCNSRDHLGDNQEFEWTSTDPFLSGNNAPVFEEHFIENLEIVGQVPTDINGAFVRNGPNPKFEPLAYQFPVDGDGMVHAIYFENGKVSYRNRWVRTKGLKEEEEAGRALFGNILSGGPSKNCANTSLVYHGGHLLALYEGGKPYELDRVLNTLGEFDYGGSLGYKMSAHPKIDPKTGHMFFNGYWLSRKPHLTYFEANPAGQIINSASINVSYPSMIHDMAITDKYVVFIICPAIFNGSSFIWKENEGSSICLIEKANPTAQMWFKTSAFFLWHFVNAYELGDQVVIDYVHHGKAPFAGGNGSWTAPNLYSIELDLKSKSVNNRRKDSRIVEYPTVSPGAVGVQYKYGYASLKTKFNTLPEYFDKIIQYNMPSDSESIRTFGSSQYSGEPLFIPRDNQSTESGGYVVCFVFDESTNKSHLEIIDPDNFSGEAIAKVLLPVRVPNGLHGHWARL